MNLKGILLSDRGQSVKGTGKFVLYDIIKKRKSRDSVKKKKKKKHCFPGGSGIWAWME